MPTKSKKVKEQKADQKIHQWPTESIHRSRITSAPYNPRVISERARRLLKDNLKSKGLMGGIVWNKSTGNLVAGHQRIDVLDAVYKTTDYSVFVTVVELSKEEEVEQNLFLNNTAAQGSYDRDKFFGLLETSVKGGGGFNLENTGFSLFDMEMTFGSVPSFLRPPKDTLGFLGGQKLADHESGLVGDLNAYKTAIQEAKDEVKTETSPETGTSPETSTTPTHTPDKNTPTSVKQRKQEYKDKTASDPNQDTDYALMVVFRSRDDKEKFLTRSGVSVGSGKFVSADVIEEMLESKFRWRKS